MRRRHGRRTRHVPGAEARPGVFRPVAHLPPPKQRQLRAIDEIIRSAADVEQVLLFGSHARGDWVEDPSTGYCSDFDVLTLVVRSDITHDVALWDRCGDIPEHASKFARLHDRVGTCTSRRCDPTMRPISVTFANDSTQKATRSGPRGVC